MVTYPFKVDGNPIETFEAHINKVASTFRELGCSVYIETMAMDAESADIIITDLDGNVNTLTLPAILDYPLRNENAEELADAEALLEYLTWMLYLDFDIADTEHYEEGDKSRIAIWHSYADQPINIRVM